MKDTTVTGLIHKALEILETEVGLAPSTLKVVASRSFKPIADFFKDKGETYYCGYLIDEIDEIYRKSMQTGAISRNVFNLRTRGTRILREVHETDSFTWKGPISKEVIVLPECFERIISGVSVPTLSVRHNQSVQSIIRRFMLLLSEHGIDDIAQAKTEHIQLFLRKISKSRPKSMDDVISSLRKLDRYLTSSSLSGLPHAGLLMAPRARDRKIYPCMPQDDLIVILETIDRSTAIGKRDYAMLLLAASTGMRAGDIACIELTNIDWRKNDIHIVMGKTEIPLSLPLQQNAGVALADYILNGRPKSKSQQVFLRSLAPFQGFKDGVSVACALRRRMKAAGIARKIGDGKTMHGIRRMLGTQMTVEGVPVTTIAQILGHQHYDVTRQYISLDIEGLRKCALGFDSLEGGA